MREVKAWGLKDCGIGIIDGLCLCFCPMNHELYARTPVTGLRPTTAEHID